ncbi:hypothetical protein AAHE18_15G145800 [Arachis hypogaea]
MIQSLIKLSDCNLDPRFISYQLSINYQCINTIIPPSCRRQVMEVLSVLIHIPRMPRLRHLLPVYFFPYIPPLTTAYQSLSSSLNYIIIHSIASHLIYLLYLLLKALNFLVHVTKIVLMPFP